MKIAVLSHTFPKSKNESTAAFLYALMLGFKHAGNHPIVVIPYIKGLKHASFPYRVISYKYIWPSFLHNLGYSSTLKRGFQLPIRAYIIAPFLFIFGIFKLLSICKSEKIDIISAHWLLPNGLIAAIVSKLTGVPYVVTLPGSDVYVAGMNILFKKLAIFAAEQASIVIADSPTFIRKVEQLGANIKRSEVIPYPVDVMKYKSDHSASANLRKHFGFYKQDVVILAVGRLVEKKGFKYLLESMGEIIKTYANVKLVIVGEGDLKEELLAIVKKRKIDKSTIFAGSIGRDKILSYYNLGDIFVMPSISDAAGNIDDQPVALLEAMACGLPVVATNFPGNSMTVADKVNGFLVPQKNVNAIKSALLKLVLSNKLRKQMGLKSRKIAVEKLSIDKIGEAYALVFEKAISSKRIK
ncbi:MAG: glycosyltransferase [Candidatus Levyibacteriota bacterium]